VAGLAAERPSDKTSYLKYCVAPGNVEAKVGKTEFRMLDPDGWMREIEGAPLKELL
jgi:hypothetical protein